MPNILDHVSQAPVLEIEVWPRSARRQHYFELTRELVADTISRMHLEPDAKAEVIAAFTAAGLM